MTIFIWCTVSQYVAQEIFEGNLVPTVQTGPKVLESGNMLVVRRIGSYADQELSLAGINL